MASKIYTDCTGHIQKPSSTSKLLGWGALLAYINVVRLYNNLQIMQPPAKAFGGDGANNAMAMSVLGGVLGARNYGPSHGVAFCISSVHFDKFICDEIGESNVDKYYDQCQSSLIYKDFSVDYPVMVYSLADFATMFNMLASSDIPLGDKTTWATGVSKMRDIWKEYRVNI